MDLALSRVCDHAAQIVRINDTAKSVRKSRPAMSSAAMALITRFGGCEPLTPRTIRNPNHEELTKRRLDGVSRKHATSVEFGVQIPGESFN